MSKREKRKGHRSVQNAHTKNWTISEGRPENKSIMNQDKKGDGASTKPTTKKLLIEKEQGNIEKGTSHFFPLKCGQKPP